jgi:hypothetical protein
MLLIVLLLWAGVATAQQAATGEPEPGSFEETLANLPVEALHQVQGEDNLHLIAAYYYGDARQWPRVYGANRAIIGRNPSVIHRGQILKIPLPAGWAPLEPYDRFLARVRAAGIPGLTAPPEAGGGKPAAEAAPEPAPRVGAPSPRAAQTTEAASEAPAEPASPLATEPAPAPAAQPAPPAAPEPPRAAEPAPPAPRSY